MRGMKRKGTEPFASHGAGWQRRFCSRFFLPPAKQEYSILRPDKTLALLA